MLCRILSQANHTFENGHLFIGGRYKKIGHSAKWISLQDDPVAWQSRRQVPEPGVEPCRGQHACYRDRRSCCFPKPAVSPANQQPRRAYIQDTGKQNEFVGTRFGPVTFPALQGGCLDAQPTCKLGGRKIGGIARLADPFTQSVVTAVYRHDCTPSFTAVSVTEKTVSSGWDGVFLINCLVMAGTLARDTSAPQPLAGNLSQSRFPAAATRFAPVRFAGNGSGLNTRVQKRYRP